MGRAITLQRNWPCAKQVAKLLKLFPDLHKVENVELFGLAEIAAAALISEQPNITLAKDITENIERRMRIYRSPFLGMLRGGTPPTRVILGLGVLFYLAIPISIVLWGKFSDKKEILGLDKEGSERFFFAALSFVAGFSERFAQDVVSKTEQTVTGAKNL